MRKDIWRWIERVGLLVSLVGVLIYHFRDEAKEEAIIEVVLPALQEDFRELKEEFKDEKRKNELRWKEQTQHNADVNAYIRLDVE